MKPAPKDILDYRSLDEIRRRKDQVLNELRQDNSQISQWYYCFRHFYADPEADEKLQVPVWQQQEKKEKEIREQAMLPFSFIVSTPGRRMPVGYRQEVYGSLLHAVPHRDRRV